MKTAIVNKIIPFSSVDGPGNRTAIFLQGCNINCLYCHNPETINVCINCGECIEYCPTGAIKRSENGKVIWNEKKCTDCDECIRVCKNLSTPKVRVMTAEEVALEINKYKPFIQGITVSGGECTLQSEFITELFRITKKMGLTNFIDSNGTVALWNKKELLEVTDKVMFDLKAYDINEHVKLTGEGNENVLENIVRLGEVDKIFEVRTVIVPDILNNSETVERTSKLIAGINNNIRYKLIKYRKYGVRKDLQGTESPLDSYMEYLKEVATQNGCKDVIIV
ncbi:YjjW family glycine radical enzyme activase [Oceanirhabdus sp. W0125-5]|uniref:YjjW family glycine radical enzyme activase n=1 Tax=Oceanirhabdus sp. W0125-5 TaxID=2999116 RepID=UPI0022F2D262|nr:YjjW family glycine radical enzyme activase [Oceanirhabdus sp. W0125-5]WBW99318.1 YjjW family glycine radical enzyme activase [Oceanirhabdus sp. W0125-5]